jgi:hypothetical protein
VLQCYPETGLDRKLDLTPVNIVSKIILELSQAPSDIQSQVNVYHIVNPKGAITFDSIMSQVNHVFPSMKKVKMFYEWKQILDEKLEQMDQNKVQESDESLWPLNTLFGRGFPKQGGTFLNDNTMKVLQHRQQDFLPYQIDTEYIHKLATWMKNNLPDVVDPNIFSL